MNRIKPKRRWLQFSLRSVLLLTLAVALWLGYEVRQARQVERTIAALRALGGDAECEPTGWSLLRLCRVPGYGQRIVTAAIRGAAADEAIELLRDAPGLREVEVAYDGTFDPTPSWQRINGEFPQAKIHPVSAADLELSPEATEDAVRPIGLARLTRIKRIVETDYPRASDVSDLLERCSSSPYHLWGFVEGIHYDVIVLADGSVAELFIGCPLLLSNLGDQRSFAVLIVESRCVGMKGFSTSARRVIQEVCREDLDHDGFVDLGFEDKRGGRAWNPDERIRQLAGDARSWLGVYKIERDGFKSLLPEDKSDFP